MNRLALNLPAGLVPTREQRIHHEDNCGCIKPAEAWGRSGWHLRPLNAEDMWKMARREALDTLGEGAKAAAVNDQAEKRAAELTLLYLGIDVAYEPCPAYLAAVAEEIRQRKSMRAEEGKRRKGMDTKGAPIA